MLGGSAPFQRGRRSVGLEPLRLCRRAPRADSDSRTGSLRATTAFIRTMSLLLLVVGASALWQRTSLRSSGRVCVSWWALLTCPFTLSTVCGGLARSSTRGQIGEGISSRGYAGMNHCNAFHPALLHIVTATGFVSSWHDGTLRRARRAPPVALVLLSFECYAESVVVRSRCVRQFQSWSRG